MKNLKIYRKALIVVDMVNGFVREGVLHDKSIEAVIDRQLEIVNNYIDDGGLIIFIKDTHQKGSTEFKRFGDTEHCIEGTHEAELVDELKPFENLDNAICIKKNSTSYMEAPDFRNLIKDAENIDRIDVIGCCTDICVANGTIALANYFDQWNRDVEIRVHEDSIATYGAPGRNKEEYENAAKLLMKQQGIQLVKKR